MRKKNNNRRNLGTTQGSKMSGKRWQELAEDWDSEEWTPGTQKIKKNKTPRPDGVDTSKKKRKPRRVREEDPFLDR